MDNRIKVGVRIRPLSSKEIQEGGSTFVQADSTGKILFKNDSKSSSDFQYDWAFGPNSDQRIVYDKMCKTLIDKVFEGYNATFFAYGQTGSGKTYTMGTTTEFEHGVMPYAITDIFDRKASILQENMQTTNLEEICSKQMTIELSYIEIYMEECYDLLSSVTNKEVNEKKKLDLRESQTGETYLDGLVSIPVYNVQEVSQYISMANKLRTTNKTAMNNASSRSHAIVTLTIRTITSDTTLISKLNLVDLAGSERAKKTMASGDILQEGISINKGLLALGNVVTALSTKAKKEAGNLTKEANGKTNQIGHVHVPYRESKLTRLLKDSLGGNGVTSLLACVSPASSNLDETQNTLRFATRTSNIVNSAKVNRDMANSDMNTMVREVNKLRDQLMQLQHKYDLVLLNQTSTQSQQQLIPSSSLSTLQTLSTLSSQDLEQYKIVCQKLLISLRTLLMQCFAEDYYIEEEELTHITDHLKEIASMFQIPPNPNQTKAIEEEILAFTDNDDFMNADNMQAFTMKLEDMMNEMPNILSIIDDIKYLETYFASSTSTSTSRMSQLSAVSSELRQSISTSKDESTPIDNDQLLLMEDAHNDSFLSDISRRESSNLMDVMEEDEQDPRHSLNLSHSSKGSHDTLEHGQQEKKQSKFIEQMKLKLQTIQEKIDIPYVSIVSDIKEEDLGEEAQVVSEMVLTKEKKINNISKLTGQYECTIRSLQEEILSLEQEKQQLRGHLKGSKTQASTGNTNNPTNIKETQQMKKELKQKSRELDKKIMLLQQKERQYDQIQSMKQKLMQELKQIQEKILQMKQLNMKTNKMLNTKEKLVQQLQLTNKQQENKLQSLHYKSTQTITQLKQELNNKNQLLTKQSKLLQDQRKQQHLIQNIGSLTNKLKGQGKPLTSDLKPTSTTSTFSSRHLTQVTQEKLTNKLSTIQLQNQQIAIYQYELQNKKKFLLKKIMLKKQLIGIRMHSQKYKQIDEELQDINAYLFNKTKLLKEMQQQYPYLVTSTNATSSNTYSASTVASSGAVTSEDQIKSMVEIWDKMENKQELQSMCMWLWNQVQSMSQESLLIQHKHNQLLSHLQKNIHANSHNKHDVSILSLGADMLTEFDLQTNNNDEEDDNNNMNYDDINEEDLEDEEELDMMDETFYPSEEEDEEGFDDSDEDNSDNERRRTNKKHKRSSTLPKKAPSKKAPRVRRTIHLPDLSHEESGLEKSGHLSEEGNRSAESSSHDAWQVVNSSDDDSDQQDDDFNTSDDEDQGKNKKRKRNEPKKAATKRAKHNVETVDCPAELITNSSWMKMTVKDLKHELAQRNLPVSGVKQELVKRLVVFELSSNNNNNNNKEEEEVEEDDDDGGEELISSIIPKKTKAIIDQEGEDKNHSTTWIEVEDKENQSANVSNMLKSPNNVFSPSKQFNLNHFSVTKNQLDQNMNYLEEKKTTLLNIALQGKPHLAWYEEDI